MRAIVALLALGVSMLTLPLFAATPAGATPTAAFTRLAGSDRYDTARLVAAAAYPAGAPTALLANGSLANFPDALAGSYLAGLFDAPILLTAQDAVPGPTSTALKDLGTKSVIILGGTTAVSKAVQDQLSGAGYAVTRVAGATRYDTAAAIGRSGGTATVGTGPDGGKTAIVASGENFPDALVAGAIADASAFPLLLTPRDSLAAQTKQALTDLAIKTVLVPGGTAAVSEATRTAISGMGITVQRIAGANRTDTAALLATFAVESLGFTNTRANLARGDDPADALAGGPLGGVTHTPTLLTTNRDVLSAETQSYLRRNSATVDGGRILGGTSAISQAVQDAATTAARTDAGPSFTSASAATRSSTVTVAYTRPVKCSSVDSDGSSYLVTVGGASNATTAATCVSPAGDGTSSRVSITLTSAIAGSSPIVATAKVGADGNTVTDTSGAAQPTGDSITTNSSVVPVFTGAEAVGGRSTVNVFYNEAVVCGSVDSGDYTVTVAGGADAVTAVACAGTEAQAVTLTLATAPQVGQAVAVTAKAGTDGNTVTDAAGARQPAGDAVSTAATATQVPRLVSGSVATAVNGTTTLTLVYSEPITCSTVDANGSDYTVTRTATADNPTSAACASSGTSDHVNLTLPTAAVGGDVFHVTVKAGADGDTVKDPAGAPEPVDDKVDVVVPSFSGVTATAGATTVTASYNKSIVCSTVDAADYQVARNNTSNDLVTGAACPSGSGPTSTTVIITVQTAPSRGDTVRVTAARGLDTDTVKDPAGSTQPVGDSATTNVETPPAFTSLTAAGGSRTVTAGYDRPIVCSTVDTDGSDFSATVANTAATVTGAACTPAAGGTTASSVTLTLDRAPSSGDAVAVTAKAGTDGNTVADGAGQQQQVGNRFSTTASTVPQFTSASISASPAGASTSNVTVGYNEAIACPSVDGDDYTVTVDSTARAVSSVSCTSNQLQGNSVTITFSGTVTAGQTVTVTAKVSSLDSNTVRDSSGAQQPAGDSITTTVKSTTGPKFVGASYGNTQTIFVDYDKAIVCSTVDAGDYTVSNGSGGLPVVVTGASCISGTTNTRVQIAVAMPLVPANGTTVTAKAGLDTDTVKDTDGNQQVPETIFVGTPPTFASASAAGQSATSTGSTLTLTYDRAVRCATVDANVSDYTVTYKDPGPNATTTTITFGTGPGQAPATASCKTAGATSDTQVVIVFTSPLTNHYVTGQTVTVTAKNGTDTDTVRSHAEYVPQPVGDTVSTTVT